jgi:hypothetical protein
MICHARARTSDSVSDAKSDHVRSNGDNFAGRGISRRRPKCEFAAHTIHGVLDTLILDHLDDTANIFGLLKSAPIKRQRRHLHSGPFGSG